MNLPMLPADKANHALYGALVFLAAAAAAAAAGLHHAAPIGMAASVVAAVLKEGADYLANRRALASHSKPLHGVDVLDALATAAGGALCWAAVLLVGG